MDGLQTVNRQQLMPVIGDGLVQRYIDFIDAKPATVSTYARALRLFYQHLADNGIAAPCRDDIIRYREALKQDHKPATVNAYIIAIRQFFKWTETEGLYPNVAQNVKGAKMSRDHTKDPLTSKQARAVLEGIDRNTEGGARDYAIMALMTSGGLRTIEVIRANIDDLRTLGDETVLYIQGKGRDQKSEFVKVPAPAEKAIRAYLKHRPRAAGGDPLFTGTGNRNKTGRMTTRSISRIVKSRLVNAGLDSDRLTAHSLRHTAATLNLLNGGSLEETQQLLRHSRIDTTLIYSHHLDRIKNKSEARIAAAIWGKR